MAMEPIDVRQMLSDWLKIDERTLTDDGGKVNFAAFRKSKNLLFAALHAV